MLLADFRGSRIRATPGAVGGCPECGQALLAKCGGLIVWHWSHLKTEDCPSQKYGPETDWHLGWKLCAEDEARIEVRRNGHRADVLTSFGQGGVEIAVEFQSRALDGETIWARERAFERTLWVVDAREAAGRIKIDRSHKHGAMGFWWRWEQPIRWWTLAEQAVCLDLGGTLLAISCVHESGWWGYGRLLSEAILIRLLRGRAE